jgi:hypothetical protein
VDVRLGVLGWIQLNHKLNIRDIKASRSYIGGDEDLELAFLEALHSYLSLVLSNVSMHGFDIVSDRVGKQE